MAYLSKLNVRESRNADGSIFSKGADVEITFAPDEVPFDIEKGIEREGIILMARAFVSIGLKEEGTVKTRVDVDLKKEQPKDPVTEHKAEAPKEQTKPPETSKETYKAPDKGAPPKAEKEQLDIILSIVKRSTKNQKILDTYLGKVNVVSIEQLSRPQATSLIDKFYKEGDL